MTKQIGEFCFGQIVRKLPANEGKVLFQQTNFEESNINWKPLYDNNEILTKKWVSFVCGKVFENCPKTKEKCYFMKPTSKRVMSTGNHLFGPKIR